MERTAKAENADNVERQTYTIGDRVVIFCVECQEERGHIVASVTRRGLISRITCPKCSTRSSFSNSAKLPKRRSKLRNSEPYERARTYRPGQTISHPIWGSGEVIALIEPRKVDVLFAGHIHRLIETQRRGGYGFVEMSFKKEGEATIAQFNNTDAIQETAILPSQLTEVESAVLLNDRELNKQVDTYFTQISESRKRSQRIQSEIDRLKKKTQVIIDKLA
jgi:hypothetical protein